MTENNTKEPVLFIHPAALYIPYKANLKQHLAWLFLVYQASEDLNKKKSYVVSLQDLKEGINYKSEKNNQALIDAIKGLTKVRVQFDMFNPETDWPYQALLKRCQIPRYTGGCRYSFHPEMHEKLRNQSEDLIPLRLNILNRFTSRYSLALYCLLISRLSPQTTYSELNLGLSEAIHFLGYKEDDFLLPGDIKRKFNQAQTELNEQSDITVAIEVLQEKRRKILGFKIIAQLKPSEYETYQMFYQKTEEEITPSENPLITPPSTRVTEIAPPEIIPTKTSSKSKSVDSVAITPAVNNTLSLLTTPKNNTLLDLNKIKNSKVRDESIKLYHQRLNTIFKNDLKNLLQQHLEDNFHQYQETFMRLLESNINALMLRNIINRNMGRKNPSLMSASQTIADCILDKYELFNFRPPEFEAWKEKYESTEGIETIERFKSEALKTAEQIHRF